MKTRLLVVTLAVLAFVGTSSSAVLACGCGCAYQCSENRCEFSCSDCSLSEEIAAADACCTASRSNCDMNLTRLDSLSPLVKSPERSRCASLRLLKSLNL
jgi:hypothetical protein